MWAHDTKGTSCRGLGKSLQAPSAVCDRCSIGWHCPVVYCGNRLSSSSLHPYAQRLSRGSRRLESLRGEQRSAHYTTHYNGPRNKDACLKLSFGASQARPPSSASPVFQAPTEQLAKLWRPRGFSTPKFQPRSFSNPPQNSMIRAVAAIPHSCYRCLCWSG